MAETAAAAFTVGEIEQFLSHEAALLDEWRLEEWLALMAPDACYLVPPLDAPDADHRDTLFLIADDRRTLASRVRQLLSGTTWAENPRSRTRRRGRSYGWLVHHDVSGCCGGACRGVGEHAQVG